MIKKLLRRISSTTITTTTTSTSTVSTTTVLPNSIDNLQLWLKADAGVTMSDIPTTPINDPLDISGCALWLDADKGVTLAEEIVPCNSPIDIPDCALWLDAEQGVTTMIPEVPRWVSGTTYLVGDRVIYTGVHYGTSYTDAYFTCAIRHTLDNFVQGFWDPLSSDRPPNYDVRSPLITENLPKVTNWADQSGNERHCSQLDQRKRPNYFMDIMGIEERPVVSFDGRIHNLTGDITGINNLVGATCFAVVNYTTTKTYEVQECLLSLENDVLKFTSLGVEGSTGLVTSGIYSFNPSTNYPDFENQVLPGEIRFNQIDPTLVTEIYIYEVGRNYISTKQLLEDLIFGDMIRFFSDEDITKYFIYSFVSQIEYNNSRILTVEFKTSEGDFTDTSNISVNFAKCGLYTFDSSTNYPFSFDQVLPGKIRFGLVDTMGFVTEIYINTSDRTSTDIEPILQNLGAGDTIRIFNDNDITNYYDFSFISQVNSYGTIVLTVECKVWITRFIDGSSIIFSIPKIGNIYHYSNYRGTHIESWQYNGTEVNKESRVKKYTNGNDIILDSHRGEIPGSLGTTSGYQISGVYGDNPEDKYKRRDIVLLKGNVSEIIMYSRNLTELERRSVESYLKSKYDFSYITPGNVITWTDQSGNERNFTQPVDNIRPFFKPNAIGTKPAIKFDSKYNPNVLLCSTGLDILQNVRGVTIAAVWKTDSYWNETTLIKIGDHTDKDRAVMGISNRSVSVNDRTVVDSFNIGGRQNESNEFYEIYGDDFSGFEDTCLKFVSQIGIINYTTGGAFLYLDGILETSDYNFPTSGGTTQNTPSYDIKIGWGTENLWVSVGLEVSEIIVYPRILTEAEVNQLNYYFALKYPVGHGRISSWADQSGNSRDAIQLTDEYKPVLVRGHINNKPGIYFSDTNQILSNTSMFGIDYLTECTLYIVCYVGASQMNYMADNLMVFTSSNDNIRYQYFSINTWFGEKLDKRTYFVANIGTRYLSEMYLDQCHITSIVFDGSQTDYDRLKTYHNGQVSELINESPIPDSLLKWDSYSIHDTSVRYGGGRFVYIYEIILYSNALSSLYRHVIEHYLGSKYNISM